MVGGGDGPPINTIGGYFSSVFSGAKRSAAELMQ
jgi:hypothetical protein